MSDNPTQADDGPKEALAPRFLRHSRDLWGLAWPVMLSRAGILLMAFVDIAMLGRYAPGAIGIANLGVQIFVPLLVVSIGLASGVMPVVAQAYGARNFAECGRAWRRALIWAFLVSVVAAMVCWQGEDLLLAFGQSPDLAAGSGRVAQMLAPGLVAQVIFACCAFYLEATRRPLPALVVMMAANLANAGLNWMLIWGNLGAPEMGPAGAALASTLVRFGAAAAMILYIVTRPDARLFGVFGPWETTWGPGGWRAGWPMRKLGLSAGLSNGFETIGFGAMTVMSGWLGSQIALDAYAISHNVVSTMFMVGLGLAIAAGVRVGNAAGAGNWSEARFAAWSGAVMATLVMGVLGAVIYFASDGLAAVYTDDPELQARAALLFLVAAFVLIPDSVQVLLGQALRAVGDAWVAIWVYMVAFLVVMVPLGHWIVFGYGTDERGLVVAIILCCVLASLMLGARLYAVSRRWQ